MVEKGLITILACDAVLAILAIPLALRKVPRNVVYGFRTRTTLSSDRVWFETNAYFGRGLLAASFVGALLIAALYGLGNSLGRTFLPASVGALVGPLLVATVAAFRHSRRIAREDLGSERG